jgi:oligopeptide/dipeptide ABC transporter ATP-binding protein
VTSPLLQVEGLTVEFATAAGSFRATDDVSFSLGSGEVLGLVGESGSGKTVTCRALMRLLPSRQARVVAGSARIDGVDLMSLDEGAMMQVRGATIGMIFQNPMTHLDPVMTIGDQIAEPLRVHQGLSRASALERAADLLRQVGIPDPQRRIRSYPHEFSGGMRQRAMIAAALACGPKVLIADEPTTALDVTVQAQILRLIDQLNRDRDLAVILITHDLGVVAEIADRVVVMYAGQIVENATLDEIFYDPQHPYTWGLLGSLTRLDQRRTGRLSQIKGQPPSLLDPPSGCRFAPRCPHVFDKCGELPPLEPRAGGTHLDRCWLEPLDKKAKR